MDNGTLHYDHVGNLFTFSTNTQYDIEVERKCHGSVDKTTDSQSRGSQFELLAAAVVPLGKALYSHCLVPRKGLKAIGPLIACLY